MYWRFGEGKHVQYRGLRNKHACLRKRLILRVDKIDVTMCTPRGDYVYVVLKINHDYVNAMMTK